MHQAASTISNLPADFGRFLEGLVSRYSPRRVVLFGSYARNEQRTDSDVDLLVVLPHRRKNPYVSADIYLELRPKFAVDLLVRKPDEVEKRLLMGDRFMRDIFTEGVVLYEGDGQ